MKNYDKNFGAYFKFLKFSHKFAYNILVECGYHNITC